MRQKNKVSRIRFVKNDKSLPHYFFAMRHCLGQHISLYCPLAAVGKGQGGAREGDREAWEEQST